jgi:iron-sulfur cluster assembly accessory protein
MASARPRPQVIRLTDAAAERIRYVMANAAKPVVGVRVGVKNGGCAGMTYTMEYAEIIAPADEVVEDKGVRVLVDPRPFCFCLGRRWTTRPISLPPSSSSIIPTRLRPAAAASRSSSSPLPTRVDRPPCQAGRGRTYEP